ncbi:MAG: ATP cone domain-containing protein, partial [Methanobacterium sp.]
MRNVVKRKGEVEPYDPNKIKGALQKATIDAGYSLEEKNEL